MQAHIARQARDAGLLFHADSGGLLGSARIGGRAKLRGACKGWPDLVFVCGSRVVFIELKAADGVLSPEQGAVHAAMRQQGAEVHVVMEATGAAAWERIRAILGI